MLCKKHKIYTRINPISGEEECPMCVAEEQTQILIDKEARKLKVTQHKFNGSDFDKFMPRQELVDVEEYQKKIQDAYNEGWKAAVDYIETHIIFYQGEKLQKTKKIWVRRNDEWVPLATVPGIIER